MKRRPIIAAALFAVALGIAAAGYAGYRASSQQVDVVTVNGQGIPVTLYNQAQTQQAVLETHYPGYMKHVGDINTLIQQVLVDQEATRRGIACTEQDGINSIATQIARAPLVGGPAMLLTDADAFGVLPPGYAKTTEAQRTPGTTDAVATWAAAPAIIKGYTEMCTTARLYSAVTPPHATNAQRNAAIDALLAQLRANAKIVGPAATLSPTPGAPLAPVATTVAVGTPSLTGNVVQVPVSSTGSGLAPYAGFSIHLRWKASVFSFASASNAGSVLPGSPFCPAPQVDADGAGVVYACASTGGNQTTTAGLLATISLTPAGTGCSPLHLFTYGGADNGDSGTGTYTIDASTNIIITATSDGSANQAGQVC